MPAGVRDLAKDSIGAAQIVGARVSELAGPAAGRALLDAASAAFVAGLSVACLVAAGVTAAGAVITALLLPARPAVPDGPAPIARI